jgi:hypothetical protein
MAVQGQEPRRLPLSVGEDVLDDLFAAMEHPDVQAGDRRELFRPLPAG